MTNSLRTCGRSTDGPSCDSAFYPASGVPYSRVCGRIIAYRRGSLFDFSFSNRDMNNVDTYYVDGVSLTRGGVGSREHIWTFVAAHDTLSTFGSTNIICPCSTTQTLFFNPVFPRFLQNNYFCETENFSSSDSFSPTQLNEGNPLWDGEGCGIISTCCQFNTPPWFCRMLDQTSTDDLELRICADQMLANEDIQVELIDVYVA